MRLLGLVFLLTANAAIAGEYAVLDSGARLHVDRHEADGAKVRLYHGGGMVEMDAARVTGFEAEEGVPPAAPAPAPTVAAPVFPVAPKSLTPYELADAAADRYGLP